MFSDLATDEGTMWEAQQYTPLLSRLKHTHKRKIIQYIVFFALGFRRELYTGIAKLYPSKFDVCL